MQELKELVQQSKISLMSQPEWTAVAGHLLGNRLQEIELEDPKVRLETKCCRRSRVPAGVCFHKAREVKTTWRAQEVCMIVLPRLLTPYLYDHWYIRVPELFLYLRDHSTSVCIDRDALGVSWNADIYLLCSGSICKKTWKGCSPLTGQSSTQF